jgi:hypothetical protein
MASKSMPWRNREQPEGSFDALEPRVRKRHAVADAGRSKFLAFGDLSHDLAWVKPSSGRGFRRELLKQAPLVARAHIDHDMHRRKEIADLNYRSSLHLRIDRPALQSGAFSR